MKFTLTTSDMLKTYTSECRKFMFRQMYETHPDGAWELFVNDRYYCQMASSAKARKFCAELERTM